MSESNGNPDLKVFSTGAVRSRDADGAAFTLISPIAQQAEAEVLAKGDIKYGAYNWEKGMSVRECLEHALQHINKYLKGDRSEPHMAHARTNLGFAIHSEVMWPELNTDLRRGDCIPPTVSDEKAEERARLRANLDAMKRGVKEAAGKSADPWEGYGAYMDGDGTIRFVGQEVGTDRPIVVNGDGTVRYSDIREGDVLFVEQAARNAKDVIAARDNPAPLFRHVPEHLRPRVATRYHIAPNAYMDRAALYRSDLQFEGHEVVARWIETTTSCEADDFDLQSCDVAIVLAECEWRGEIDKARRFGKPVVVIGGQPDDFPRFGTPPERWFRTWEGFLNSLHSSRNTAPAAR